MKIAIACDHAGFDVKEHLKRHLEKQGHKVADCGTDSAESCDYPDFAVPAAVRVADGDADRGVLVCTTGVGMSIIGNKVQGVRAALCLNDDMARMSRSHNDANVLVLAAKYTPVEEMERFIDVWCATGFEGGRHARRVGKITEYETKS